MPDLVVNLLNVSKSFGRTTAISDLSLQLSPGDLLGLTGPDGAGKSTLIRLMAGVLVPEQGLVQINGFDMARSPDRAREGLGYLSQNFSLYEDLTVLENIRFFAEVRGLSADTWQPRALEILTFVGLDEFVDRLAGKLSGGMKQKLGLATALVHKPRLLLLDEPTAGVDPVTRQDFWQLILKFVAQEGVSVVISTPHLDEVSRCRQVAMLKAGKIALAGSPQDLQSTLAGRIIEIPGMGRSADRDRFYAIPEVQDVQAFGDNLHVRIRKADRRVVKKVAGIYPGSRAQLIDPSLEDVFIAFTEGDKPNG